VAAILERAQSYVGRYTDADARTLALEVGQRWPEMAAYARLAQPGTHWCGIFLAKVLGEFDIRPPFGDGDLQRWMWVDSWKNFGTPVGVAQRQPGDLCLWLGNPHHIAFYAGNGRYTGGNQSDAVTTTTFRTPDVVRRAEGATAEVDLSTEQMPLLVRGDTGPYVRRLQVLLGFTDEELDGDFGERTEAAVREVQLRHAGLEVDGEVGPMTWAVLLRKPIPRSDEPPKYLEYRAGYKADFARMSILPSRLADVNAIARRVMSHKARYVAAGKKTGVPWFVIAAWHDRESSGDFSKQLAQGDPLDRVSVNEPSGRGPFPDWEASAEDALIKLKALDKVRDWPIERIAYESERYNGFGYRSHGVPSAYLWSFSNIYRGGKYVADRVFDFNATDKQCGVMPLISQLAVLDNTIDLYSYTDVTPPIDEPPIVDAEVLPPRRPETAQAMLLVLVLLILLIKEKKTMPTHEPNLDQLAVLLQQLVAQLAAPTTEQPKALPPPPPPPPPPPVPVPATGTLDFRTGIVGVLASLAASYFGVIGAPVGPEATTTGALSPLIIAAASALGVPTWIGSMLSSFLAFRRQQK
jgi:lysozyme family protein